MSPRSALLVVAFLALAPRMAPAQGEPSVETKGATVAILDEIEKKSELMANLEYLCDMIGPRLTGSPNLKRANEWTRDRFKDYGLENAHLESWKIARGWTRGPASGRVVSPVEQRLWVESAGWSPSTNGPVKGPVVYFKVERLEDFEGYKGKLKGAWVVFLPVTVQPTPKKTAEGERMGGDRAANAASRAVLSALYGKIMDFLVAEGAAGILRDSNKEHALIDMTGATTDFTISKLPQAFLSTESYGLLWRLLKRGPVEAEFELKNTITDGEVEVFNTVAELRGTEKPDEVVIIGGHLDSWDLGTGATDNGTGTMAVLEAARALKAAGVKPRRTIRFILFSGEEQGLHGSKHYVKDHESEMAKVSGVLVHDMGTGKVTSIGLQGRYDLREPVQGIVEPFQKLVNMDELSMRNMGGTDHLSFLPSGVPAFAVVQDPAEYRKTHHTPSDTFDKVYADEVNQGAKVLAAWAYNVAMRPDLLPRDPKPKPSEGTPSPKPAASGAGAPAR
jgi:carboxypeptidase Q